MVALASVVVAAGIGFLLVFLRACLLDLRSTGPRHGLLLEPERRVMPSASPMLMGARAGRRKWEHRPRRRRSA